MSQNASQLLEEQRRRKTYISPVSAFVLAFLYLCLCIRASGFWIAPPGHEEAGGSSWAATNQVFVSLYLSLYLYLCISAFVFVSLYLCISLCVFVFVYFEFGLHHLGMRKRGVPSSSWAATNQVTGSTHQPLPFHHHNPLPPFCNVFLATLHISPPSVIRSVTGSEF